MFRLFIAMFFLPVYLCVVLPDKRFARLSIFIPYITLLLCRLELLSTYNVQYFCITADYVIRLYTFYFTFFFYLFFFFK